MSIKDIISSEIRERIALQKDLLRKAGDSARIEGSIDALTGLLESFIDSLPEQPVEGLEEEVKRYYSENFAYISSDQPTLSILTNIARHFAEWGAEHLKR